MADVNRNWNEVGDNFAALGRKLKERFDAGDESPASDEAKDALRKLSEAAERFSGQAGEMLRDPELKDSVQRVGKSLTSALAASFDEVGDQLSGLFKRAGGGGGGGAAGGGGTGGAPGGSISPPSE